MGPLSVTSSLQFGAHLAWTPCQRLSHSGAGGSYEYGMEPISTMPMGLDAWTLANEAVLTSFVYYIRFLRCRCASRERAMSLVTATQTSHNNIFIIYLFIYLSFV